MTLEELRRKRLKWVDANRENGFDNGIRRLLTELYPDNAHFIYELLQNAEDARATKVCFILREDGVEFEHNGDRLFSIEDVDSITSIGVSTKRDDPTNIGKFGIGFKAVFAYTSTPEIASGQFHFRIRDLVVPDTGGLTSCNLGEKETRFSFPFDNPAKPPEEARGEIEKNLRQLDESTLLFLSNIRKIEYLLPDSALGFIERKETDGNQIEILVQHPDESEPDSAAFLRFDKTVEVNDENGTPQPYRIAVAFGLEKNQEQEGKQSANRRRRTPQAQWEIRSLEPGKVCIYFPAEKETSNLRFHLHAPFASTVARDSVRDCSANDELRDYLADLIAESMTTIRDQQLLTVRFLATLPNQRDNLPSFYQPMLTKLIEAFQKEALTPMKRGGHAPATGAYHGRRQLSDLIDDESLATILGMDRSSLLWVANPQQQNQREDNFLSMLDIDEWTMEDLIEVLVEFESIGDWLAEQSDEWHQKLYAYLDDDWNGSAELRVVRCSDGSYRTGGESYFPDDDVEHDEDFPRVAKTVYSTGRNEREQDKARRFLEDIGVREVNETERVRVILENRYSQSAVDREDFRPDINEIGRFVSLVKSEPEQASLFSKYYIFQCEDELWRKPKRVFLDSPYLDTGLSAYYQSLAEDSREKRALSPDYENSGIEPERLGKFAERVGSQTKLHPRKQRITSEHPAWTYISSLDNGGWSYSYGIDEDYDISEFSLLLTKPDLNKSKLIWDTVRKLPEDYLQAKYRSNSRFDLQIADSTFVHRLRKTEWIPQEFEGEITFVKPQQATVDKLPGGFPYEKGQKWLRAIRFGEDVLRQKESKRLEEKKKTDEFQYRETAAKSLGFDSGEEAEEIAELKRKDPEGYRKWRESNRQKPLIPERPVTNPQESLPYARALSEAFSASNRGIFVNGGESRGNGGLSQNPSRRREKTQKDIAAAIENEGEREERFSFTLRKTWKDKDDQVRVNLAEWYGGRCQICEKTFTQSNGEPYFEGLYIVSYTTAEWIDRVGNVLCLCPWHSAMFQFGTKEVEEDILTQVMRLKAQAEGGDGRPVLRMKLCEGLVEIKYAEKHLIDLQEMIRATQKPTQSEVVVADRSDTWIEQDQEDLTAASLRYAETRYPEEEIV